MKMMIMMMQTPLWLDQIPLTFSLLCVTDEILIRVLVMRSEPWRSDPTPPVTKHQLTWLKTWIQTRAEAWIKNKLRTKTCCLHGDGFGLWGLERVYFNNRRAVVCFISSTQQPAVFVPMTLNTSWLTTRDCPRRRTSGDRQETRGSQHAPWKCISCVFKVDTDQIHCQKCAQRRTSCETCEIFVTFQLTLLANINTLVGLFHTEIRATSKTDLLLIN